jgi:hypothetical protein
MVGCDIHQKAGIEALLVVAGGDATSNRLNDDVSVSPGSPIRERFPAKREPVRRRKRVQRRDYGAISDSNESETAPAGAF